MYDFNEACPISMAASILCERWTVQIVRELFLGATKYSEIQKYLPNLSPSLLKSRLSLLEKHDIVMRKQKVGTNRYEYFLTPSGKALGPVLTELGKWGMSWASKGMTDKQNTASGILRDLSGAINVDELPSCDLVIQINLTDVEEATKQYIYIQKGEVQTCSQDMGFDVDIYITATTKILTKIWYGELSINRAIENNDLLFVSESIYRNTVNNWLNISTFTTDDPKAFI